MNNFQTHSQVYNRQEVERGDAYILWKGVPHYVSDDGNSSIISSF